jgi:hypothetical protein
MRSLNAPRSWWLLCDLRQLKYDTYPIVGRATFVLHYQCVSRIYGRLPFALVSFEDGYCNMAAIIDRIGILLFGLGPLGYDPVCERHHFGRIQSDQEKNLISIRGSPPSCQSARKRSNKGGAMVLEYILAPAFSI